VFERRLQLRRPALVHVVPTHQQQIAHAFDGLLHQAGGFTDHLPPQIIELFINQLGEVKTVEHNGRLRQVFGHRRPIRRTHVHAHGLNPGLAQTQGPPELPQGVAAASVRHPDNPSAVQVNDQRVKLLPPPDINFINGKVLEFLQTGMAVIPFQPRLDDVLTVSQPKPVRAARSLIVIRPASASTNAWSRWV